MAPHNPATHAAALPSRPSLYDPWNSSSTGHQRAENRLGRSPAWRVSRNHKLAHQFGAGSSGGGKRMADTVGAGSEGFGRDGRKKNGGWERGASGLRTAGQRSLWECVGGDRGEKRGVEEEVREGMQEEGEWDERPPSGQPQNEVWDEESTRVTVDAGLDVKPPDEEMGVGRDGVMVIGRKPRPPQIFRNLTFYINGSTMPLVSDHKLKHLLSAHGGHLSVALGRRTVTHVIVGVPCSSKTGIQGSGGGLAASKIQKEVTRVGGKGVKFVSVEWVLASVTAGTRLSEARFETVKIGGAGQKSVLGMFEKEKKMKNEQS